MREDVQWECAGIAGRKQEQICLEIYMTLLHVRSLSTWFLLLNPSQPWTPAFRVASKGSFMAENNDATLGSS